MKYLVSLSGGKDSTAMLIRMLELGYQVDDIVFVDVRFNSKRGGGNFPKCTSISIKSRTI